MFAKLHTLLVVMLWLVAMSWLMIVKVLPALRGGQPPDAQRLLPEADAAPLVEVWRMTLSEQPFGAAASQVVVGPRPSERRDQTLGWLVTRTQRNEDLTAEVRTRVHFDRFPLGELVGQFLGPLSSLARPFTEGLGSNLRLDLHSQALLDLDGRLQRFESTMDFDGIEGVARMDGLMSASGKLNVSVSAIREYRESGERVYGEPLRREIDLPRDALVSDSFAPQTRLAGLRPGQSWTFPVYRAFPPNSPVQIMEAQAEYYELVYWNGEPVETMRVVFRNDAGSELGVAQESLGHLWTRADGTVLVQELKVGNRWVRFVRLANEKMPAEARAQLDRW